MINGIYGDEAHLLSSEQWVNVYRNECGYAIYYMTCQVKELSHDEDFLLEPITEDGDIMTVNQSIKFKVEEQK